MKNTTLVLLTSLLCSCSIFGIQDEEGPDYKVLTKVEDFEIRQYNSYIVAKTTVKGDFDEASSKAFRILANYIFGDNSVQKEISMTSPVEVEQESQEIAMTSPVKMTQESQSYTMTFSMPSKYTLETLPKPDDERIQLEEVDSKIIASHEYSWFSSQEKNDKKAQQLREWIKQNKNYQAKEGHSYAGYNPPWTLPFFRRNEVHIEVTPF